MSKDGTAYALSVRNVKKTFGGTQALRGVSFDLTPGSIHALLGGNGSGKSTLIKILAGVHHADGGELELAGNAYRATDMTPSRARDAGLRFVHQQETTFPDLTVAENLAIGHGFAMGPLGRVRWREVHRRTQTVLDRFEIDADPRVQLGSLSPASRAMVSIARALQDQEGEDSGVLVLDEPTASLPASEVDLLLTALRRYAAAGQTILYVTHRLDEVMQVADRATVFRDGAVAATAEGSELTHESLVELIMGRRVEELLSRTGTGSRGGTAMVRADSVSGGAVRDVSFIAHQGEILGIAGLLGSGRSSLLKLLFGAGHQDSGSIELNGEKVRFDSPRQAMDAGVAFVPEDRLTEAAFAEMSVLENLGIASTERYFKGGRLRHRAERRDAHDLFSKYMIRASSPNAPLTTLSGGNQQKVILARWMRRNPRLLLLDEPTQGVDVGARAEIWQLVRAAVDRGGAAIVVSSDMDELPRVCDRVIVLRNGRNVAELSGPDLTEERLNHLTLTAEVI